MTNFDPIDEKEDTLTVRIERDILDSLSRGSKLKSEDLEGQINRILRLYTTWQSPSQLAGNIPFSKYVIQRLFNNLSEEQIEKVAREIVNTT